MAKKSSTDILTEDLLTLKQACREIPRPKGTKPFSYMTLWRWHRHGIKRNGKAIKLPCIRIGAAIGWVMISA